MMEERIPLAQRPDMPRYRSHKIVGAHRIAAVSGHVVSFDSVYSALSDETIQPPPVELAASLFTRYTPSPGDYYVVYEDGYDSFSPAKAFEEGYAPCTAGKAPISEAEIAAVSRAPRITPADLEANIDSWWYFTGAEGAEGAAAAGTPYAQQPPVRAGSPLRLLTFCVLVLRNGFTVIGTSACASPANFDADIGRRIAREDAVRQVWPLLGYELRTRLAERAPPPTAPYAPYPGYPGATTPA